MHSSTLIFQLTNMKRKVSADPPLESSTCQYHFQNFKFYEICSIHKLIVKLDKWPIQNLNLRNTCVKRKREGLSFLRQVRKDKSHFSYHSLSSWYCCDWGKVIPKLAALRDCMCVYIVTCMVNWYMERLDILHQEIN